MRTVNNNACQVCGICFLFFSAGALSAAESAPLLRDHEAGFVVSYIEYGLAADAEETGGCPEGMTLSLQEIYALTDEGERRESESDEAYMIRLQQAAKRLGTAPDGRNLCMHPEAAGPDPYFRTVKGSGFPVFGIDLDGHTSREDFPGMDGGQGVDNQWFRVVGCSRSYQSTGLSNNYNIGMLSGSWGILINLRGVEDIYQDDRVEVLLSANADPIRLGPSRDPLPYATYTAQSDPRFRAMTTGRIDQGVLTTEPVDARFWSEVNSMYLERPLLDARLKVTISSEGTVEGYLSGYTPVEAMYDVAYGYRNGIKHTGETAPLALRSGSANGAAAVLGHTCHGAYHALHELADGHPDPETGVYTSISTQYRIKALPAFVVEADESTNVAATDTVSESGDPYE